MNISGLFKKLASFVTRHQKIFFWLLLTTAILVFVFISFVKIGAWSIWFDESFSVSMIKHDFAGIWHYTALDVNAPLYYFALKAWSFLVGYDDVALRAFSVLCGSGAIIVGALLCRRLFGNKVGMISIALITLSPMLLRYSTEMRGYTMLILLLLLSTYAFVSASSKPSRLRWLVYGFFAAISVWTHYYAVLVILAQMIYRGITIYQSKSKNNTFDSVISRLKFFFKTFFDREFLCGVVFAALVFLPWLLAMLQQFLTLQGSGFWIPQFSLSTLGNFFSQMIVYDSQDKTSNFVAIGLVSALITMTVVLIKGWHEMKLEDRRNLTLVVLLMLVPPVALILLSMPPLRPMFINRYVIFSMISFSIVAAALSGVNLKTVLLKRLQVLLFILILSLNLVGLKNILYYGNYNLDTNSVSMVKEIMNKVDEETSFRTPVITESTWIFYDASVYATDKNPVYFLDSSTRYEYGSLAMLKDDIEHKITDVSNLAKSGQKIWFISSSESDILPPSAKDWQALRTLSVKDSINGNSQSRATEYLVP